MRRHANRDLWPESECPVIIHIGRIPRTIGLTIPESLLLRTDEVINEKTGIHCALRRRGLLLPFAEKPLKLAPSHLKISVTSQTI
jgi:hypothetical protein